MRPRSCEPSAKEKLIKIMNKIIILPSRFLLFTNKLEWMWTGGVGWGDYNIQTERGFKTP